MNPSFSELIEPIACPFANGSALHVYLVKSERLALIDSGISTSPDAWIVPYLQTTGRSLRDIKAVILTHGHEDHFGGNGALSHMNPQIEFMIHKNDLGWAQDYSRYITELYGSLSGIWEPDELELKQTMALCGEPVSMTRLLADGDRIDLGSIVLQCYEVPGHSPGHLLYRIAEISTIICGDAIQDYGTNTIGPAVFPLYSDVNTYLKSLDTIRAIQPEYAATAHFGVLQGDEIECKLRSSERFVAELNDRILDLLQQVGQPLSIPEMVMRLKARYYAVYTPGYQFHATTLAHCVHLEKLGLAEACIAATMRGWTIRRA